MYPGFYGSKFGRLSKSNSFPPQNDLDETKKSHSKGVANFGPASQLQSPLPPLPKKSEPRGTKLDQEMLRRALNKQEMALKKQFSKEKKALTKK